MASQGHNVLNNQWEIFSGHLVKNSVLKTWRGGQGYNYILKQEIDRLTDSIKKAC